MTRHTITNTTAALALAAFLAVPALMAAQQLQYVPLEPLSTSNAAPASLGGYLNTIYSVLLTLGALFAVVTFTVGGVVYMTSESLGLKHSAKERMQAALWGLLLLAISALILQVVNPDLLRFNIAGLGSTSPTLGGGGGGSGNGNPTQITINGADQVTITTADGNPTGAYQSYSSWCTGRGNAISPATYNGPGTYACKGSAEN